MPAPTTSPPVAAVLARTWTWLSWYRRPIAVALVALALVGLLREVRPAAAPRAPVVVAAHELAAGATVSADDVRTVGVLAESVPAGALRAPPVGSVLTLPVRSGEVLTDVRVLGAGLLDALGPADLVAAPVHLADPAAASVVRVGEEVDVLAAGDAGGSVVAARARVLTVPTSGSAAGFGASSRDDGVVVLAVTPTEAVALAGAASTHALSVAIRGDVAG